ncbi:hypothetical protein PRVXT_001144 [Proteinivorax tanatarense]|uniref:ATP synthase F0 subunit 8 n=1 Tax=Proteinivorax tanatarense TaxID=1260629 RepID=A0AAU7VQ42_9FIRM
MLISRWYWIMISIFLVLALTFLFYFYRTSPSEEDLPNDVKRVSLYESLVIYRC